MVRNARCARHTSTKYRGGSQYFLITRQKEKCGRLRFTLLCAHKCRVFPRVCLSHSTFTHNPATKLFFPVRAHVERMTVIQRSTLASARGLYFPRNYSWGNLAPRTIFFFFVSLFPFFRRCIRVHPWNCRLHIICAK